MSDNLSAWLQGEVIRDCEVFDERLVRNSALSSGVLAGERVESVYRRAKYSVITTAAHAAILHYRMSGKPVRDPGDRPVRAVFHLQGAPSVYVLCTRRFGTLDVLKLDDLEDYFADRNVGPECWPERRDASWWAERFANTRVSVKQALMDQKRVAGIGNIMAAEILWAARIDPRRACTTISGREWASIASAAHDVIARTIACESGAEIVYVGDGRDPSDAGFQVYGREGEAAPCCGGPVERFQQSGRSTFACLECQV